MTIAERLRQIGEALTVSPSPSPRTPKTLHEAIAHGLYLSRSKTIVGIAHDALPHVRDYLAQRFTPELMDDPKVRELWNAITGESK